MGQIKKQSLFNAASIYIGIALGALNTIVLYPAAFKGSENHWGFLQLLLAYGLVVSSIGSLGIGRGLIRFIPYYPAETKGLIAFGWRISLFGTLVLSAALLIFKEPLLDAINAPGLFREYAFTVVPLIALLVFAELLGGVFQGFARTRLPNFLNEVGIRIGICSLLVVHLIYPLPFDLFLVLFLSIYAVRTTILLGLMLRNFGFHFRSPLSSSIQWSLIKYGSIALFSGSTSMLLSKMDQLFIGGYLSLEQLAYYALAYFMGSVIQAPARSISPISTPVLSKAWSEKNMKVIDEIYDKTAITQLLVGGALFCLIFLSLDDVYAFLPKDYSGAKGVFIIVGLTRVFGGAMGVNGRIIMTSPKFRVNLIFNVVLVIVAFISNYTLVPVFGLIGAAMAVLICVVLDNLLRMLYLYSKYGLQPFSRNTLIALVVIVIPLITTYLVPQDIGSVLVIILRSTLYIGLFVGLLFVTGVSNDLTSVFKGLLRRSK